MADDKNKKRPRDAKRINLNQPYEVNWWCDKFNCSKAELRTAVKAVGDSASAVRKYFNS